MNVQALVAWFTPVRARLVVYGVAALLAMVLVAKLPELVEGVFLGAPADRAFDAGVAAANRVQHEQHHRADSVKTVATRARIVYVVAKRSAVDAVAALPAATVHGTTLTILDTAYTVPPAVAGYVAELLQAVSLQSIALAAADTAIRKTQDAQALSDTIASTSDSLAGAAIAHERGNRPGFFGRAWGAVRTPVYIGIGFALGVLAKRAGL